MEQLDLNNRQFLRRGYKQAQAITKRFASSFYFASLFLSPEKRRASYAVYALCRASDQAVDEEASASSAKRLEQIRQRVEAVYSQQRLTNQLLAACRDAVLKYRIPKDYFLQLLEGMEMDITKDRFGNFEQLHLYCYKAAGVVGLIMLKIFGSEEPEAKDSAVDLGIAMQLTNILRDIKEDFQRGRIYLPQDELARFGVKEADIAAGSPNSRLISLIKFQIARARSYYKKSAGGINLINNANSRLVILLMHKIYVGILEAVEKNNYDVFSRRAYVSSSKKALITLKILIRGRYL